MQRANHDMNVQGRRQNSKTVSHMKERLPAETSSDSLHLRRLSTWRFLVTKRFPHGVSENKS